MATNERAERQNSWERAIKEQAIKCRLCDERVKAALSAKPHNVTETELAREALHMANAIMAAFMREIIESGMEIEIFRTYERPIGG